MAGEKKGTIEWRDTKENPPPDDHTEIELRFGHDPIPLRTFGCVFHRNVKTFGGSPVIVLWRSAPPKPH